MTSGAPSSLWFADVTKDASWLPSTSRPSLKNSVHTRLHCLHPTGIHFVLAHKLYVLFLSIVRSLRPGT